MTDLRIQKERAQRFLEFHQAPPVLILPNAWDVISAKIYDLEGFKAVGTTSAGIAATLGYPDGQKATLSDMLAVTRRIVQSTNLPVSADIEAGYSDSIEGVVETVQAFLRVGVAGINIEDSTGDPDSPLYETDHQTRRIAAIREAADRADIHLVINARTDAYMLSDADTQTRLAAAIERAQVYRQAGADCVFVPDLEDLDKVGIATLVNEIDSPLNIIAGGSTPSIAELESIGVARVSFGPRPMRMILAALRNVARDIMKTGNFDGLKSEALTYDEVNAMFSYPEDGSRTA